MNRSLLCLHRSLLCIHTSQQGFLVGPLFGVFFTEFFYRSLLQVSFVRTQVSFVSTQVSLGFSDSTFFQVSFIGFFYRPLLQVSLIGLSYRPVSKVSLIGLFHRPLRTSLPQRPFSHGTLKRSKGKIGRRIQKVCVNILDERSELSSP